jgi:hypothetical protein
MGRGVTLDHKRLGEVRHGEDGSCGDHSLERTKSRDRLVILEEAILLEEGCQRHRDRAIVVDELVVVARQAEEAAHCSRRAKNRLVLDGLHLGWIHGDACLRYDVAEVGDGGDAERALGALDEEALVAQLDEDSAKMTKMIRLGLAVYQDVIKENEQKAT